MKSVKQKILLGFGVVLLIVGIQTAINIYSLTNITAATEHLNQEGVPLLNTDSDLALNMAERLRYANGYLLFGDEDYLQQFEQSTEEAVELETQLMQLTDNPENAAIIERTESWADFVMNEVFPLYASGEEEEASLLMSQGRSEADSIMEFYETMQDNGQESLSSEVSAIDNTADYLLVITIIISVIVLLMGVAIALFTANIIVKPIKMVTERARLMASGDLSGEPLAVKSKDEIGVLVGAVNQMSEENSKLLQEIHSISASLASQSEELTQSADEVRTGSQQIASTMEELASGTESQADHSTRLSEAMAEFAEKMQQSNHSAAGALKVSEEVIGLTGNGSEIVGSSVKQMNQIDQIVSEAVTKVNGLNQKTKEITSLVTVVKNIAEQTNLLALNAAIEAARAGEHGKGFAVVADEVRKLAEQVSDSSSEITTIVEAIQTESASVTGSLEAGYKEVEKGTAQMTETETTFYDIKRAMDGLSVNIEQVSRQMEEMVESSEEMGRNIEEIAAVAEESAAGVQETTASAEQTSSAMQEVSSSAEELSAMADQLQTSVTKFKLN